MKAVIFDFDGTLTDKTNHLWKRIWEKLGYEIGQNSYYASLYKQFINNSITHKQWCELTLKAFQDKGFTKQMFCEIIKTIKLMKGAEDLIKNIHSKGVKIHIVSGNIISVIEKVLKNVIQYIDCIKANEFLFDKQGNITDIIGTQYDYEGKAKYVKELCLKNDYQPNDILFIGNSINDEFVYQSGARTLCVNPANAKSNNHKIWHKVVFTNNLNDLLKEIV